MAAPVKNEKDRLIGCWKHPTGGWEVCYYQGGKKHSEYRKSKTLADKLAAQVKKNLEGSGTDEDSHPVLWWEKKLREAAEHLLANPSDEAAVDTAKTIASLATAGLRAAAYYPPPNVSVDEDTTPVPEDLNKVTTEELVKLLGDKA